MRDVLSRIVPKFQRVLLIESGRRDLLEGLIPGIYKTQGGDVVIDVVTCYAGEPKGLRAGSTLYRLSDYRDQGGRQRLKRDLQAARYNVQGMICSGEAIMARWKWYLALQVPAKAFVLNENGDYFWIDHAHAELIRKFILFRIGLAGAAAVPTLLRLCAFPFAALYLVWFAASRNLMRRFRAS
jgi:hypothetical protein